MGFGARLRRWLRPPRRLEVAGEGKALIALSMAVGLAAVNTGNNLLYLLLGWSLSFIVASGMLSEATLRRVAIRRRLPATATAGEPFLIEVIVANQKTRFASFALEAEDCVDGRPVDKRCFFLKVPPGQEQRTSYRHTFARRGLYRFDGIRVATRFPFGLFRKSRLLDTVDQLVVYPRLTPVARPAPRSTDRGEAQSARLGRRGEFWGLRPWRDGDDRRSIHWRSSARSGRLLVREVEDERSQQVAIVVDNALPDETRSETNLLGHPAAQALERAISVAAGLAVAYLDGGWSVELVARGEHVGLAAGRPQRARILRALALLPCVAPSVPFAATSARQQEALLVVPRGVAVAGRPSHATLVEA